MSTGKDCMEGSMMVSIIGLTVRCGVHIGQLQCQLGVGGATPAVHGVIPDNGARWLVAQGNALE